MSTPSQTLANVMATVVIKELPVENEILKLVERPGWQARSPKTLLEPFGEPPAKYIIISQYNLVSRCTDIGECCANLRDMQTYHMDVKGFDDIAFNYVVSNGGIVFEGRGYEWRAATAKNWNSVSYGLAFIGLFDRDNDHCKEALRAAQLLFKYLVLQGRLDAQYKIYGIRQVRPFDSPDKELYDAIKSTWPDHWEERPCAPAIPCDEMP